MKTKIILKLIFLQHFIVVETGIGFQTKEANSDRWVDVANGSILKTSSPLKFYQEYTEYSFNVTYLKLIEKGLSNLLLLIYFIVS